MPKFHEGQSLVITATGEPVVVEIAAYQADEGHVYSVRRTSDGRLSLRLESALSEPTPLFDVPDDVQIVLRYSVYERKQEAMLLRSGDLTQDSHIATAYGATKGEALHAVLEKLTRLQAEGKFP